MKLNGYQIVEQVVNESNLSPIQRGLQSGTVSRRFLSKDFPYSHNAKRLSQQASAISNYEKKLGDNKRDFNRANWKAFNPKRSDIRI